MLSDTSGIFFFLFTVQDFISFQYLMRLQWLIILVSLLKSQCQHGLKGFGENVFN